MWRLEKVPTPEALLRVGESNTTPLQTPENNRKGATLQCNNVVVWLAAGWPHFLKRKAPFFFENAPMAREPKYICASRGWGFQRGRLPFGGGKFFDNEALFNAFSCHFGVLLFLPFLCNFTFAHERHQMLELFSLKFNLRLQIAPLALTKEALVFYFAPHLSSGAPRVSCGSLAQQGQVEQWRDTTTHSRGSTNIFKILLFITTKVH